jgi:hypothetical protein
LNLHLELPGVIAHSVDGLIYVVPPPLECVLSPRIDDIFSHRGPHIRNIGAGINPSSCAVWGHGRVREKESICARRVTQIQSADAPSEPVGFGIVSMHELAVA